MKPTVAIVIPCYNDGEFIGETLASIEDSVGAEVVVVDDGSTDGHTLAVLDDVEARGLAQVLHITNGGPGAARMAGVAATTADAILPLDADDRLVPGGLAALLQALAAHPDASFAFGDYEAFGGVTGRWKTPPWDPWAVLYANWWPVTSLFRRDALLEAGGWQLHGYEDWDLWMALAERGRHGVHCGATVYARRLHGGRVNIAARRQHAERYRLLRSRHEPLYARAEELRREASPTLAQRVAYPLLLGDRRWFPIPLENLVIAARLRRGRRA